MSDNRREALNARRNEIRKLMEKVQRAVASGRIRFNPELDYRIRQRLGQQVTQR